MPINIHNELVDLGYALERGLLTWQNGYRYMAAVYDRETYSELITTTAKAQRMALADMMKIRNDLVPQAICQFYPADSPATWFIAFLLLDKRRVDGYQNPVGFSNVLTALDRFQQNGLGCSLEGAFWYSKPFPGYFRENPHCDFSSQGNTISDAANVPSISQFIADAQRTLVKAPIYTTRTASQAYAYSFAGGVDWAKYSPAMERQPEPEKPNKLGRQIKLED